MGSYFLLLDKQRLFEGLEVFQNESTCALQFIQETVKYLQNQHDQTMPDRSLKLSLWLNRGIIWPNLAKSYIYCMSSHLKCPLF